MAEQKSFVIDEPEQALTFLKLAGLGHSSDLVKRSGASGFVRDWPVFSSRDEHRAAKRRLAPLFGNARARAVAAAVRRGLDRLVLDPPVDIHDTVSTTAARETVRLILGTRDVDTPVEAGSEILNRIVLKGRSEIGPADRRLALAACDRFIGWSREYVRQTESPLASALRGLIDDGVYDEYLASTMLAQLVTGAADLLANGVSLALYHLAGTPKPGSDLREFVEEALMWNAPVAWAKRMAVADLETSVGVIRRGDRVGISIGAASIAAMNTASASCPISGAVRNLPFGHGVHYCLGAVIAKAVMVEAVDFFMTQRDVEIDLASAMVRNDYGGVSVVALPGIAIRIRRGRS